MSKTTVTTTVPSRANGWMGSELRDAHYNFDATIQRVTIALTNHNLAEANRFYYGVRKDALTRLDAGEANAWIPELLFEKLTEIMREYDRVQQMKTDLKDLKLALEKNLNTCPTCDGVGMVSKRVDGTITQETCLACEGRGVNTNPQAIRHIFERAVANYGSVPMAVSEITANLENARFA
jgi:hypothetical protein